MAAMTSPPVGAKYDQSFWQIAGEPGVGSSWNQNHRIGKHPFYMHCQRHVCRWNIKVPNYVMNKKWPLKIAKHWCVSGPLAQNLWETRGYGHASECREWISLSNGTSFETKWSKLRVLLSFFISFFYKKKIIFFLNFILKILSEKWKLWASNMF